jgi:hypothetical protein
MELHTPFPLKAIQAGEQYLPIILSLSDQAHYKKQVALLLSLLKLISAPLMD